jgi:hypothetical protein
VATASYYGAVGQEQERRHANHESLALLALAKRLRDAAASANRPDVVAKVDEAILLLAGTATSASNCDGGGDKTNVVLRILDGFGL